MALHLARARQAGIGRTELQRHDRRPRTRGCPGACRLDPGAAFGKRRYLCGGWLRFAIPSESDDTRRRCRWDTHPFWEGMARVWDADPNAPPLTRVSKSRLPSDDYLFRTGLAGRRMDVAAPVAAAYKGRYVESGLATAMVEINKGQ